MCDNYDDDDLNDNPDDADLDWDDDDYCYECGGYGDDYFINDKGELECYCPYCGLNPNRDDWDE